MLVEELESADVAIRTAGEITAALGLIVQGGITAVISDISMPGGTGLDLLSRVRATGRNTPFLFLTGNARREYILQAMHLGAFDLLDKPFELEDLSAAVSGILQLGIKIQELELTMQQKGWGKEFIEAHRSINLTKINYLSKKYKTFKVAA
jgi:DNA-binding NtrC family response regulator